MSGPPFQYRDFAYKLVSVPTGKVMDVWNASEDDGAPVGVFGWKGANGSENQQFRILPIGARETSEFYVSAVHSGRVLEVPSKDDGVPVQQIKQPFQVGGPPWDDTHQRWVFFLVRNDPPAYIIVSTLSSKCMVVREDGMVVQRDVNFLNPFGPPIPDAALWSVVLTRVEHAPGENNRTPIYVYPTHTTGRRVAAHEWAEGAPVVQEQPEDSDVRQGWWVRPGPEPGYFSLTTPYDGKWAASAPADGERVLRMRESNGAASQLWEVVRTGDFEKDLVRIQSPTSKLVWDVERASPDPGASIILWQPHSGPNQQFGMKPSVIAVP